MISGLTETERPELMLCKFMQAMRVSNKQKNYVIDQICYDVVCL